MQTEDGNIRQLSGSEDDLSTTDKTEVRRDIASKARPGIAELLSTGCASLVLSHYKQHQGDRATQCIVTNLLRLNSYSEAIPDPLYLFCSIVVKEATLACNFYTLQLILSSNRQPIFRSNMLS